LALALLCLPAQGKAQGQPQAQVPPQQGLIDRVAPAPPPPRLGPSALPPEPERATGPGAERRVAIGRVEFLGNEALTEAALRPLVASLAGQTVPLARLEEARFAVLRAYREAGFPYILVAAALVPEGDLATLRLAVTEGFVAAIKLDGEIGPAATQALRFLDRVRGERPIRQATLERALLLVTDIPGVTASGILRPQAGGENGALELVVRLQRRAVSGFLSADNRGSPRTGAWQGLLVAGANSFTSLGERTEASVLLTEGNRQVFGQVSAEAFAGGSGLRLRAHAGMGEVRPGSALAALGYLGETSLGGLGASYPVIRSRPLNLSLTGQLDAFNSYVSVQPDRQQPRQRLGHDRVTSLRFGVEASGRDALLLGGAGAASTFGHLRLSQGLEALGASGTGSAAVQRLGSDFGFTKLAGEVTRLQPLARPFEGSVLSLQLTLGGQYSNAVLPPSEKFYLGGNRLGRGFFSGQVSGDNALATSVELQLATGIDLNLPRAAMAAGRLGVGWLNGLLANGEPTVGLQFYGFYDQGRSFENKLGDPDRRLASWGGGVRAIISDRLQLDLEGLQRLTRMPDGTATQALRGEAVFARLLTRF
jgi:hemolysin activation/secretion protein